ncbi:hypothetical protein AAA799O18_00658 [Marine Group I thaumarchaeote SCGC AAA799-O18]|nr:hypothetical protein AAA799O18_00658 [Marine Group I thaumarchaeote SCGC AAA799-O18]
MIDKNIVKDPNAIPTRPTIIASSKKFLFFFMFFDLFNYVYYENLEY